MASHDFRDLATEVNFVRGLISESSRKFPDVNFYFCEGVEAFRKVIWGNDIPTEKLDFDINFIKPSVDDVASIEIVLKSGRVFGPQPFLAIETKSRRFIHDNLDFSIHGNKWFYAFHSDTLPLGDVARLGVASNDKYGNICIKRLDFTKTETPCQY